MVQGLVWLGLQGFGLGIEGFGVLGLRVRCGVSYSRVEMLLPFLECAFGNRFCCSGKSSSKITSSSHHSNSNDKQYQQIATVIMNSINYVLSKH